MYGPLQLAFSFLTRFPVGRRAEYGENDYGNSYIFFPVVGLAIGALMALAAATVSYIGTREATTAFLLLVILVAATGGLHLDGVADTADGFFGGQNRDERLRIMKESSTGKVCRLVVITFHGERDVDYSRAGPLAMGDVGSVLSLRLSQG